MSSAPKPSLHQVVEAILPGDATSDHVYLLRRWLREMGFNSDIYTDLEASAGQKGVLPFSMSALAREPLVIFHHTMGSNMLDELNKAGIPLLLIYHNITPPEFFSRLDIMVAQQLLRGRRQLQEVRSATRLALSDSPYSERELVEFGFEPTGVLPIVLDESQYDLPLQKELFAKCRAEGPLLLFVGRVAPNKRQEDLLALLYHYRRVRPEARLVLVGGHGETDYLNWLLRFADRLGIQDAITFTGHVSQQEMVTFYRAADLFISMSEHEGFGKPLIESMYLDLPVLAYAATAVPTTMGGAGVLFGRKDYEALAEVVDLIIYDTTLREQLIAGQRDRVKAFLEPQVRGQWRDYLEAMGLLAQAQAIPGSFEVSLG